MKKKRLCRGRSAKSIPINGSHAPMKKVADKASLCLCFISPYSRENGKQANKTAIPMQTHTGTRINAKNYTKQNSELQEEALSSYDR